MNSVFIPNSMPKRYILRHIRKNRDSELRGCLIWNRFHKRGLCMTRIGSERLTKLLAAGGIILGLSACTLGEGYYGDNYVNGGYGCDPYAPFDDYYACDDGYGYANIGFGGGWYDSYYYPGYGTYIFDRRGSRYAMKRHHRRHWARQRAAYGTRDGHRGRRHADRRRNATPEQRAERRERRAERREERQARRGSSTVTNNENRNRGAIRGQRARGQNAGNAQRRQERRAVRGNRPAATGQPARANRQANQARRPAARQAERRQNSAAPRQAVRRAPVRQERRTVRTSPRSPRVERRDVNDE